MSNLPAPPDQGLKGWNLGRLCLFCPKWGAWAKLGEVSEETPPGCQRTPAGLWCLISLIKKVSPHWPNVESEKFWGGKKQGKAALQNGCFLWKGRSLVWVFIALKNSSCFGQKATEKGQSLGLVEILFPQRSKSSEGGVQGCSWRENSSGQCFGSGNRFPCYWAKSITLPALFCILHNTTSEMWHPLNPHKKCELRKFFLIFYRQ